MSDRHPRMAREEKTMRAMVKIYCNDLHGTKHEICSDCNAFLSYALLRLEKCPFQEGKTTCANCPVHCYKHDMREKAREVMGHAGPRMSYRHPVLALYHLIDGRKKEPFRKKGMGSE